MKRQLEKDVSAREWLALFGLAAVTIAITEFVGLSQKWDDIIVFTVVLFECVLVTFRELWKNPTFWRNLLKIVGAHIIVFAFLAEVLPLGRSGFPKVILTVGCMAF